MSRNKGKNLDIRLRNKGNKKKDIIVKNKEKLRINGTEDAENNTVGHIRLENDGNVLTHIFVKEEYRLNGIATETISYWINWCKNDGFENAFIVQVVNGTIDNIIKFNISNKVEKIDEGEAPVDVRPDNHSFSTQSFRIQL